MIEEDKRIIEEELDKIIEEFNNQEFMIQDYKNYSKILRYEFIRRQKLYKLRRECIINNCSEQSIIRSHSIPKSSILESIAFEGQLLSPKFDITNELPMVHMAKVGIKNASTFPGFCEKHEKLFNSFENDGIIDNAEKAILQSLRTICRERVQREIELEINTFVCEEYKKKINNEAYKKLKESLAKHPQFDNKRNFSVKEISMNGIDYVSNKLTLPYKHIVKTIEILKIFEKELYTWLRESPEESDIEVHIVNVDIHFPIALCGIGEHSHFYKGEEKQAHLLMNVLPKINSTDIVCVYLTKEKDIIDNFLDISLSDPLQILNLIERFMIYGTDHWYINPNYWQHISKIKQQKIMYDLLYSNKTFMCEYPISIFDDIRLTMLQILNENIIKEGREPTEIENQYILKETKKLSQNEFEIIRDKDILAKKITNFYR